MFPYVVAITHAIVLLDGSGMPHYRGTRGYAQVVDERCFGVRKGTPARMLPNLTVITHGTEP